MSEDAVALVCTMVGVIGFAGIMYSLVEWDMWPMMPIATSAQAKLRDVFYLVLLVVSILVVFAALLFCGATR